MNLNLKELEKGSTFTHIRNTESASRKSNLQGDLILAIVANTSPGKSTTSGAVTGGTGTYANARGVFSRRKSKAARST